MVRAGRSGGKSAGARASRADQKARETSRLSAACFVYVLGCSDRHGIRTYVGWTNDMAGRLRRHNAGKGARSTRGRVWLVLYAERLPSKQAAMSREYYLKRDRRFRKKLMQGMLLQSLIANSSSFRTRESAIRNPEQHGKGYD